MNKHHMAKSQPSRPGCSTPSMSRQANCHPNPPPGSSPQAATAAKKDIPKREGVVGVMKAVYDKIMANAPAPDTNPQSRAVIADKKEQAEKITPDAK
jgi:hypothetical protein